ncbi:MAG: ankyrin repeat domain-containing protein [Puniceicoccales bacterium]|jgi:hypothetical protein|nr:ankyrin repeat domain-containing protein [Puniceicoccales bacterium]
MNNTIFLRKILIGIVLGMEFLGHSLNAHKPKVASHAPCGQQEISVASDSQETAEEQSVNPQIVDRFAGITVDNSEKIFSLLLERMETCFVQESRIREWFFSTAFHLIFFGVDVNTRDNMGRTLLHWVANERKLKLARCLLRRGAYVNARDHEGIVPLHWAVSNNGGGRDLGIVKFLIRHGADINAKDNALWTPLHYATIYSDNFEIVELLVKMGADVNVQDDSGATPLAVAKEIAAQRPNDSTVQAIVNLLEQQQTSSASH